MNEHPHHLNGMNKEHTTDVIYINSENNDQGGYRFMILTTGKIIVIHAWKEVPSLFDFIKRVK